MLQFVRWSPCILYATPLSFTELINVGLHEYYYRLQIQILALLLGQTSIRCCYCPKLNECM